MRVFKVEFCELLLYPVAESVYPVWMRDGILKLLMATMLFVSVEGVAESVDEMSFHQTHHAHADDGERWFPDSDSDDHDGDSCEHFCHAHVVGLTAQFRLAAVSKFADFLPTRSARATTRSTAPPTPPPNCQALI